MFDDPWYTAIVGVTLSVTIIALNIGRVRKPRPV
jgi:hypothetical protein